MGKKAKRSWGSIRKRGKGDTWELRYPTLKPNGLPGPRKREIFYGNEDDAYRHLEDLYILFKSRKEIQKSTQEKLSSLESKEAVITVDYVWNNCYLPESTVAASTLKGYRQVYEAHIKQAFGGKPIVTITHRDIQKFITSMSIGAAKHAIVVARIIWKAAEYDGIIKRDENIMRDSYKIAHVVKDSNYHANKDIYSEKEINEIINECEDRVLQNLLIVSGKGGLRPPEASGLKCENIEFFEEDEETWAVVSVLRNVVSVDKKIIIKDTKTAGSIRSTIIEPPFAAILKQNISDRTGWLLDDGTGVPLTSSCLRDMWKRYITRTNHPYIPPKNFRNSYSTSLRANGMDEGAVYSLLGHTSSEMLRKHYNRPGSTELIQTYKNYRNNVNKKDDLELRLEAALSKIEELTKLLEERQIIN